MTLLRKQILWLVVAIMAGIAGGYLAYAAKSVAYTATAQVDVEAHVIANTTPVAPNMATERAVAISGVVLDSIAQQLGATTGDLAKDLKAVASGTSNILSISCTMPTPVSAQNCAAAAAAGYIAFRNDSAASVSTRTHDPLHATLVTAPLLPVSPAGLGKKILLPLGAVLGLMLGIGAIFLRDHLDDRVRDRADLERCLEAPVLAAVPRVPRRAGPSASIFSRAPLSPAAEAYRHLRVRLEPLMSVSERGTVVLVTSGNVREGRTSVAANLATALAHSGTTVTLVDADLRRPSLSTVFGVGARPGLTDLLTGRATIEEVAVPTDVPGLRLVTVGGLTDGAADILEGALLTRAFVRMRAQSQVIVVDSAPTRALSDAITLARVSDIAVIVADTRRTHRADVRAAVQDLRAAEPGAIVGVLNKVSLSLRKGQARPAMPGGPRSLAPAARVPSTLATAVPPRGPNGKGPVPLGAWQLGGHGPAAARESDAGEGPVSPPDPE
jgi:succinoglycan biosynthesis transport protein ExoP